MTSVFKSFGGAFLPLKNTMESLSSGENVVPFGNVSSYSTDDFGIVIKKTVAGANVKYNVLAV
jgi:hypothetical protein